MDCWICGDEGTTGEHIYKRSDLKMLFGKVSQQRPIYLHYPGQPNVPARGLNAKVLKSSALLCPTCNNARSASCDRAWEAVSAYIHQRTEGGRKLVRFSLKDVPRAPGVSARALGIGMQLYFVKLWGTRLAEVNPGHLVLPSFARAFLRGEAHPFVGIRLKWDENPSPFAWAAVTEHHEYSSATGVQFMTWAYSLNRLLVHLSYAPNPRQLRQRAWRPGDGVFVSIQQGYG